MINRYKPCLFLGLAVLLAAVFCPGLLQTTLGAKGAGGKPPKDTAPEPILLVYARTHAGLACDGDAEGFCPRDPTFIHLGQSHGTRPADLLDDLLITGVLPDFRVLGREANGERSLFGYHPSLPEGDAIGDLTEAPGLFFSDVDIDTLGFDIRLTLTGGKKTDRYWSTVSPVDRVTSWDLIEESGVVFGFVIHVHAEGLSFTKIAGDGAGAVLPGSGTISMGDLVFLLDTDADGIPDIDEL